VKKTMKLMMKRSGVIAGLTPFGGEKSWHIGAGREQGRGMVPGADGMDRGTGAAC
jgi:hypothetical protein